MSRNIAVAICLALALGAGMLAGEFIYSSPACRAQLLLGRGPLLAVVHGHDIYEQDVHRDLAGTQYLGGADSSVSLTSDQKTTALNRLVANIALKELSRNEMTNPGAVTQEYQLYASQILPPQHWAMALKHNRLSPALLQASIASDLRAQDFVERQVANQLGVSERECLQYYRTHLDRYMQPDRYRASHLFLAAPPETAPDVVEQKRVAIEDLWQRLGQGEKFADLVASASEDEATKTRGGDLGFFSEWRMPADFFSAVKGMQAGQMSAVIRTRLGFHVVQLTASLPPYQKTFEESRPEILEMFANQRRAAAVGRLTADLSRGSQVRLMEGAK